MTVQRADERRQMVKDSAHYLSSTVVAQAVGMLRTIVLPVLLGPAQLGVWNLMGVVIGYGANGHLGILHGLNKKLPVLRALGQNREREELKDSVFWGNLLLGIAPACALFLASFQLDPVYASASRIIAIALVLQLVFVYYFSLLRADNRFNLVSKGVAGLSFCSSALVLLLAYLCHDRLWGALCGLTLAYLCVIIYWACRGGYRFAPRIKWPLIGDSFRVGLPLIILGLMDMILLSLDRWMIAWQLPATALGFYALGVMASNLLGLVPTSAANVLYPRMLECFASTGDRVAVSALMLNPVRVMAVAMVFLISAGTIFVPVIVLTVLPKYIPTLPLIEVLVPAAYFLALAPIPGSYLVTLNRQRVLVVIQVAAMITGLLLDSLLLWAGYGVRGIAYGTLCSYGVYGLGYVMSAVYLVNGDLREALSFLLHVMILFMVMLVALWITHYPMQESASFLQHVGAGMLRFAAVTVLLSPFVWLVNRKNGMLMGVWLELVKWRNAGRAA